MQEEMLERPTRCASRGLWQTLVIDELIKLKSKSLGAQTESFLSSYGGGYTGGEWREARVVLGKNGDQAPGDAGCLVSIFARLC